MNIVTSHKSNLFIRGSITRWSSCLFSRSLQRVMDKKRWRWTSMLLKVELSRLTNI